MKGLALSARADKRAWTRPCGRRRKKKGRLVSEEMSPAGGIRTFIKPQAKTRENGFDFPCAMEGHKAEPPDFPIAPLAISLVQKVTSSTSSLTLHTDGAEI